MAGGGSKAATAELLDEDWEWQLQDNPEFASQAGEHRYAHLLQDLSPAAFDARRQHGEEMVRRGGILLQEWDCEKTEPLYSHLTLFMQSIKDELTAFELGCHLYPVNSIGYGGVHNNFVEALDWLPEAGDRHAPLLARLMQFDCQVGTYIDACRALAHPISSRYGPFSSVISGMFSMLTRVYCIYVPLMTLMHYTHRYIPAALAARP